MDPRRFNDLARAFPDATRRGLIAAALAGMFGSRSSRSTIAKNKKGKKKPLSRNAFGCVNVGDPCKGNDANCCSGICQGSGPKKGKRDRSRCIGHDESTCIAGQREGSCGGTLVSCTSTAGRPGVCNTTTGNAAYCTASGDCFPCTKDVECVGLFGPQAACIQCSGCEVGTACVGVNSGSMA